MFVVKTNQRTEHFQTKEAARLFIQLHITQYIGAHPEHLIYTNAY